MPLSGNGTPAPQGAASLTPTSLSFAPQQVGTTSASQSVTLTNTGAGALAVGSITPSGDFLLSGNLCTGKTLTPNQSCAATVAFKPAASGARTGSLSFADGAPNSPQTVALSGNGVVVQLTAPSTPTLAA
ncbi:MAG: choice-of-anchor D domain-containing protein, partial [Chloroflexi bacterium]